MGRVELSIDYHKGKKYVVISDPTGDSVKDKIFCENCMEASSVLSSLIETSDLRHIVCCSWELVPLVETLFFKFKTTILLTDKEGRIFQHQYSTGKNKFMREKKGKDRTVLKGRRWNLEIFKET